MRTNLHQAITKALSPEVLAGGTVIRAPEGSGPGYWVGAPGAYFDSSQNIWYVCYRIRRPRGCLPDRGAETRVASSKDLKEWKDVLSITKDQLKTASIQKSVLTKRLDKFHLFTSYVDESNKWCVSVMTAATVEGLSPQSNRVIFKADQHGLQGMKDPFVLAHGGQFYMLVSVALATESTSMDSHSTLDIYNTGECLSATGLAVSKDLESWTWQGIVFAPKGIGKCWDGYCRRINSAVACGEGWLGFYDGIPDEKQNYEERCGFAWSAGLTKWESLSEAEAALASPFASRSVRYLDVVAELKRLVVFYEFSREDGAHDLRVVAIDRPQ